MPRAKVVRIDNGIAFEPLTRLPSQRAVRASLGFSDDDVIIASCGNVKPAKGFETLLDVSARVRAVHPRWHFVICGDDRSPYARELVARARGKDANLHFLGYREDASAIVKSADIFLTPSRWEGLSIALLEALALGKAIVASDIPSTRAVIDGRNGVTFPVGDGERIASLLEEVLSRPVLRRSYEDQALRSSARYSIAANVDALLAVCPRAPAD